MQYHDGKKLPPGWVKCASSKYGRDYFFDTQTGRSVWFPPSDSPATTTTTTNSSSTSATAPAVSAPHPRSSGQDNDESDSFSPPAKRARQHKPSPPPGSHVTSENQGGGTKVAVIVPYRDLDPAQRRSAHLEQFVPYMESFLARAVAGGAAAEGSVEGFRVYVVEQSADDGLKFNRGKLLNIGFDLARQDGCGAFLLHDVDLLPSEELAR